MNGEEIGVRAFTARLANAMERVRKEPVGALTVEPQPYVLEMLATLPTRLNKDGIMLAPLSALVPRAPRTERAALPLP